MRRVHTIPGAVEINPGDLAYYVPGVNDIQLPVKVIGAGVPAFGKPTAIVKVTARGYSGDKELTVPVASVLPRKGWQRKGGRPVYYGHVCVSWVPCAYTDPDAIPAAADYARAA